MKELSEIKKSEIQRLANDLREDVGLSVHEPLGEKCSISFVTNTCYSINFSI